MTKGKDAPGEIPPGVRLHLEASRAKMRELGVTEGLIEIELARMESHARAEAILREACLTAILRVHEADGWRARRRLRKALSVAPDSVSEHLRRCDACGRWLHAVGEAFLLGMLPEI